MYSVSTASVSHLKICDELPVEPAQLVQLIKIVPALQMTAKKVTGYIQHAPGDFLWTALRQHTFIRSIVGKAYNWFGVAFSLLLLFDMAVA